MSERITVDVEGRHLTLSNLDKVLYPAVGYTKGEVIEYYRRIAPALLNQLAGRPVTRRRWPNGVRTEPFFEKNKPNGTPSWVRTVRIPVPGSASGRATLDFVIVEELATLIWSANLAALELHAPQWRVGPHGGVHDPDRLVIDLDPGRGVGLAECMRVALLVQERLAEDDLDAYPVTSGAKGLQLYAAVSGRQPADIVEAYVRGIAGELERSHPNLVLSQMTKALRTGKVFLDWSQNTAAKTTIVPYSLRGGSAPTSEGPTVATPLSWDEVAAGKPRWFTPEEVADRVDDLGDLLEPAAETGPKVPLRT